MLFLLKKVTATNRNRSEVTIKHLGVQMEYQRSTRQKMRKHTNMNIEMPQSGR